MPTTLEPAAPLSLQPVEQPGLREDDRSGACPIAWVDGLSVDHPGLDRDHKVLFNLVNGLQAIREGDGPPEDLSFVVKQLEITLVHHFETEERYLVASNYPHLKSHEYEHRALLNSFSQLKSMIAAHDSTVREYGTVEAILSFLHDVTLNHILVSDLRYREFLRQRQKTAASR